MESQKRPERLKCFSLTHKRERMIDEKKERQTLTAIIFDINEEEREVVIGGRNCYKRVSLALLR